jgi:hypothetical protein
MAVVMTLDAHARQVAAGARSYAIAILEYPPAR